MTVLLKTESQFTVQSRISQELVETENCEI